MTSVRLMHPTEIGVVVREGGVENPIEVCDDSDDGGMQCNESIPESDKYSIDGMENMECMSDFDPDIFVSNANKVFGSISNEVVPTEKCVEKKTVGYISSIRTIR